MLGDNRLVIVGTGHVFKESVREVAYVIESLQPSKVCVELDRQRYFALRTNQRATFLDMVSNRGMRFALMASFLSFLQERIGRDYGILPGADMLSAIEAAKSVGAKVFFVDMDINKTLPALASSMSFMEKARLLGGAMIALLPFSFSSSKEVSFDEGGISEVLKEFKKTAPGAYKVLIKDRNSFMARNIVSILSLDNSPSVVVAVVGAGHLEGLIKDVERLYADKRTEERVD